MHSCIRVMITLTFIATVLIHPASTGYAASGTTTRANVSSAGSQASGGASYTPSTSSDGRYVTFASGASNLVTGDTNFQIDIFVRDRQTGTTTRVSVDSGGNQANGSSHNPRISAGGHFVVFSSGASNLVSGDTNGSDDIFVHELSTGMTSLVSADSVGNPANNTSTKPSISSDGRYVAFASSASNLVVGDTNGMPDIFVHDRDTGATSRISVATGGDQANSDSSNPRISADGNYVVFASRATNLITPNVIGWNNIYLHHLPTGTTSLVSSGLAGIPANADSDHPDISANGQYVVFQSSASNLVLDDTNVSIDVFVLDRVAGTTSRASVNTSGVQSNLDSLNPSVSGDGGFVAFESFGFNLVAGTTVGIGHIYLRDIAGGTTSLVSIDGAGTEANSNSYNASVSAGGEVVAFASDASNLVASDTNFTADIFVHDSSSGPVNAPPTVDAGPDVAGVEGTSLALNGSVIDADSPDANIQWSVSPDAGTSGTCTVADPSAASTTVLCDDDGSYTATLTADDDVNPPVSDTATLTVGNVEPIVDAGPDTAITTGDTFSGSGSFSDPGADSWSATVDYGDGDDVQPLALAPDNSFDLSHTYPSAGVYTVTVTVMDGGTGAGSDSLLVSVTDAPPPPVAPVITALTPDTVEANYADDLPLLVDGSGFDAHTTLNWDGTVLGTELVSPTQLSALVPASLLVSTDDFEVIPVTVANAAGTSNPLPFTIYGPLVMEFETALVGPGQTVTVSTAPTTLGDSGLKATLVRAPAAGGPAIITAVSYPTDPLFPTDPLLPGGFGFVDLRYDALPPNRIHAGDTIAADFYVPPNPISPDPSLPPSPVRLMYWTGAEWSTVLGSGGASPIVDLTANLDGTASLGRVSVTFDSTSAPAITGLGGTVFGFVEVTNQAPVVTITGPAPGTLYPVGAPVEFSGAFTDTGSHTASWSFGSISVPGAVIESGGSGSVSATYSFTTPGIYPITLSVSDGDGAVGEATTVGDLDAFIVVYDPNGGFVTGGGWITSPEGAYAADPSLSGKATFGFVARYKKGANVPNGNTEFQFKDGDLSFKSTSYEWLVVAGARAQFKGTGTINGAGNYGFMLTANDGQQNGGGGTDRFRIKIWDKNNGDAIVYDNQMGATDGDNPTTALGGGSIVIHKSK